MPEDFGIPLDDDTDDAPPAETPAPEAQTAAAIEEPPVQPPPPEDEDDLDAHITEDRLTRERLVPLSVAKEYRQKAGKAREEAQSLSDRVKALEEDAQKAADAARQWQDYANSLRQQQPQPQYQQPQVDPRVEAEREKALKQRAAQLAKRYDWYTSGGELDIERGMEEMADREREIRQRAEEIAQQQVAPVLGHVARQTVTQRQNALNRHLQDLGVPLDQQYLSQLASTLPERLLMDGNTHLMVNSAAIGKPILDAILRGDETALKNMGFTPKAAREAVQQAAQQPVQQERSVPLVTEPVTRHAPAPPRFTGLAARAARDTKMTPEEYEKRYGSEKITRTGWTVLDSDVG